MPKLGMYEFNPIKLIDEVKRRPGLYRSDQPLDREEKLMLWKEVGSCLYNDWATFSKATAYDRVLQLQRKWRSLRDAYNRELRARRSGTRVNRRVYMYFKRMSFLGGFEGSISEDDDDDGNNASESQSINDDAADDPLVEGSVKPKKRKRIKKQEKRETTGLPNDEAEMPMFPITELSSEESDSDKLFLLSFLQEMRQLPLNVKMWVRAQIATIMQEAVASHFANTHGHEKSLNSSTGEVKIQRRDSTEGH